MQNKARTHPSTETNNRSQNTTQMSTHNEDVPNLELVKQSDSKLEKNQEGLFFALTDDILKKQVSEPKPVGFLDEMKFKLDKIKKELSC